jgi:hypothetical protein
MSQWNGKQIGSDCLKGLSRRKVVRVFMSIGWILLPPRNTSITDQRYLLLSHAVSSFPPSAVVVSLEFTAVFSGYMFSFVRCASRVEMLMVAGWCEGV